MVLGCAPEPDESSTQIQVAGLRFHAGSGGDFSTVVYPRGDHAGRARDRGWCLRRSDWSVTLGGPERLGLFGGNATGIDAGGERFFSVRFSAVDDVDLGFDQGANFFFHSEKCTLIRTRKYRCGEVRRLCGRGALFAEEGEQGGQADLSHEAAGGRD